MPLVLPFDCSLSPDEHHDHDTSRQINRRTGIHGGVQNIDRSRGRCGMRPCFRTIVNSCSKRLISSCFSFIISLPARPVKCMCRIHTLVYEYCNSNSFMKPPQPKVSYCLYICRSIRITLVRIAPSAEAIRACCTGIQQQQQQQQHRS